MIVPGTRSSPPNGLRVLGRRRGIGRSSPVVAVTRAGGGAGTATWSSLRALVLDEHADILGLREQIEQRVDELLEQRLGGVRRGGRVKDLRERVELALDQAHRLLIGDSRSGPS